MPEVLGTFLAFKVKRQSGEEQFDFADLFWPQTMLLRLGTFGFLAVFDDSKAVMSKFHRNLKKIDGPLSKLQLREVMAELAWLNIHLKERPRFQTYCDLENEMALMVARRPEKIELNELDFSMRGDLMHHLFKETLPMISWGKHTQEELKEAILAGLFTMLFDEKGQFNKTRMRRRAAPTKSGKSRG
jgi:hypothetical protein